MQTNPPLSRLAWIIEGVLATAGVVGVGFFLVQAVIWARFDEHMSMVGVMGALMMAVACALPMIPLAASLYRISRNR